MGIIYSKMVCKGEVMLRVKHKKSILKSILSVLFFVVLTVYISGYIYFKNYYYPNTFIEGIDFSMKKRDSKLDVLDDKYINKINLANTLGEKESVTKEQIGYKREYSVKELDDQLHLWFLHAFSNSEKTVEVNTSYDKDLLEKFVDNSVFIKNKKAPKDAEVIIKNKEAIIVDEIDDNLVDKDYLKDEIVKAFESNRDKEVVINKYSKPKLTSKSKEIIAKKDELNKFLNSSINVKAHDKSYTVTVKEVYNEKKESFDKDKIRAFVNNMARSSDTINKKRKFTTYDKHDILLEKGTYGYKIFRTKTTDRLFNAFTNKDFADIRPSYSKVGYKGKDIGNTYIEVDLSAQKLYFIKDKELVKESPLVSGQIPGAYTLTGVNSIKAKVHNRYLIGKNRITKKKYKSLVKYWMPIDYTGIGLHDASWQRGNFSPTKYLSGYGSNGCINLPEDVAEYLFKNADIGTPVLVYETTTKHSKPHY